MAHSVDHLHEILKTEQRHHSQVRTDWMRDDVIIGRRTTANTKKRFRSGSGCWVIAIARSARQARPHINERYRKLGGQPLVQITETAEQKCTLTSSCASHGKFSQS